MTGITLRQLLMGINRYENIRIEDEFGDYHIETTPWDAIEKLTEEQLEQKFDYLRTYHGDITIGMNSEVYEKYFL